MIDNAEMITIKLSFAWVFSNIVISLRIILGLTTCLVIDRYSYKQMISNKFTIPDYDKITKKATMDNEFKSLRLRDLRIVATLGVGGIYLCLLINILFTY